MIEYKSKNIVNILLAAGYKLHPKGIYEGMVKWDGKGRRFHAMFVDLQAQTKVRIHYDVTIRNRHQIAFTRRENSELAYLNRIKLKLNK